ncbi:uncharacterized protein TNCV_690831 [Trichonephila clavipes]|nr:uncharacterized protein TNCV_690831 [Trichonephila clavipes]
MEPISSYITKLARNVFRSIENHDNPIIRAQTMFTYPHPKLKYAYATAKWQLPLKPPYKRLRRWHLKILISVISVRKVFSEESEWKSESSYWLLNSEDNGSGKMAAHVGGGEWCSDGCPVGAKIYEVEKETAGCGHDIRLVMVVYSWPALSSRATEDPLGKKLMRIKSVEA